MLESLNSLTSNAKGLFSFLVSSSIFIALNGLLLTLFAFILYNVQVDIPLLLCSFLVTFSVYTLNKTTDRSEDTLNNPSRVELIKGKERIWVTLSILSLSIALTLGFLKSVTAIIILLIPFMAAFLYSIKISPKLPRLKEVFFVKSIIVATSWAFVGSLLPTIVGSIPIISIVMMFVFIFIMLFINTVIFDVRDIKGDRAAGIRTIPAVLGIDKTKDLLILLNLLLVVWIVLILILNVFTLYMPVLVFSIVYNFIIINVFCKEEQKGKLLLDLMVDGEWIPLVALLTVVRLV